MIEAQAVRTVKSSADSDSGISVAFYGAKELFEA